MSIEFRLPKITATNDAGKLAQIQSYMYQLVEQLNWAMKSVDTDASVAAAAPATKTAGKSTSVSAEESVAQAYATFNSIKSLIIKSADIVNAYYDKISTKLEGLYVAESDFGIFAEQTSQDIEVNSGAIEQFFSDLQYIITDIDTLDHSVGTVNSGLQNVATDVENLDSSISDINSGLQNVAKDVDDLDRSIAGVNSDLQGIATEIDKLNRSVIEVNAHIKSGLLYYDGAVPVFGLEIGQRTEIDGVETFNKYAQFTSDKLSFFDNNGYEVAYFSDRKLYITDLEVTRSQIMGGFKRMVVPGKGVVTKWIGG